MTPSDWPSLAPQNLLADRLFGAKGAAMIGTWLDAQIQRTTDPEFARLFADHIALPGVASSDYNHRLITTAAGQLLAGIRFYGQDVTRPFVEIVAHSFDSPTALSDCVAREWAVFGPRHYRTLATPGAVHPSGTRIDMTIYAAPYRDLLPPDNRVTLAPFASAQDAAVIINARYDNLATADPALARNIAPAQMADLERWHAARQILAIRAVGDSAQRNVGALAIAPGSIEWIEGDEVNEEVVLSSHAGQGLAASAQRAWAALAGIAPDRLLIGTIDGLNIASRRTATKAGRRALLDYAFTQLQP